MTKPETQPSCPPAEILLQRRNRLREKLRQKNLDALLVLAPANRFYLSAFQLHDAQPDESSGCLVISANGDDWLITDSRYELEAKSIWPADRVSIYSGSMAKQIGAILRRCSSITAYEARHMPVSLLLDLETSLSSFKPLLQPVSGMVEELRMIKDEYEISAIEKSFALNHAAIAWLDERRAANALADLPEKSLAWQIENFFRENGASELAFATIAATGINAAKPHAEPGQTKIGRDTVLLVDLGCRVDNYCSDQTRVWWLGEKAPNFYENTLTLVKKAQQAALDLIKPGAICADVYHAAKKVFEDAGVAGHFTHGLGHGIGLQTHEAPSLSPRSGMKLEAGMTVTVEPGLYYPEWGGIRWEYTVIVEKNGCRVL